MQPIALSLLILLSLGVELAAATPNNAVRVDMVGYLPNESKYAMVAGGAPTGAFEVRRVSDNVAVYSNTLAAAFTDADSGDSIRTADFSALTTPGSYYLNVAGVGDSYNFDIQPNAFASTYTLAMRAFYGQRCGTAVNLGTVDGVAYSYAACHSSGAATDLPATHHASTGLTGSRNSGKGWHDAGDYGKYIVNSGISTGEMLWTYEWWNDRIGNVNLNIPESANATPDILDEARWNLEWMLTMQDTDGGVFHKCTSAGFGGFTLPAADNAGTRYIIGTSAAAHKPTAATADFAAVMAIAYRLFLPYDAAFANTCLTAAQNAWTWVQANPNVTYTQPAGISTGGYGDGNPADERLWAAAELFRSTGTAAYSTYVVANAGARPYFSATAYPQDWATVKNLALWTYHFSTGGDATVKANIRTDTLSAATTIANRTNGATNGYKVSLTNTQYVWGSNGGVSNYGIFLLVADRMQPTAAYTNAALNNLHYLLGRNTHNTSFVSHVGEKAFLHPHHRPSGSPSYVALAPWPGLVSGGPCNQGCNDGSGLDALPTNPAAKRWVDETASYASNEIAINWQAPLVFLLAYTLPTPTTGTATPTATRSPVPSATATATRTASPTLTRSPTATLTLSPTPSITLTRSPTATASGTPSPSRTASPTPSFSPSATLTATRSATPTGTLTIALSATPSITPTRTATPSASPTASWSPSASRTATASGTPSATLTRTATLSASPSVTLTRTQTASPTQTPSATPSATLTRTQTATSTPSPSVTPTASPTFTAVPTGSSLTPTPTITTSHSHSPTVTLTRSPTITLTVTPTITLTRSPTVTLTATPSVTLSATPTLTLSPTLTLTRTATSSASPTASWSPSTTLTATPSVTATVTVTFLDTYTNSPTITPSATVTATPSPSVTLTATPSATATMTRSPTLTSSPTVTATASVTATITVTFLDTYTNSPTPTSSATPTTSWSPSATLTGTPSATATLTASPTLSATRTATPSQGSVSVQLFNDLNGNGALDPGEPAQQGLVSLTDQFSVVESAVTDGSGLVLLSGAAGSATLSVDFGSLGLEAPILTTDPALTLNAGVTLTRLLGVKSAATPTVTPVAQGPLYIEKLVAVPNPVIGSSFTLAIELLGPADSLELAFYSQAFNAAGRVQVPGPLFKGWNQARLDLPRGLRSGTYFIKAYAVRGSERSSASKALKLVILR